MDVQSIYTRRFTPDLEFRDAMWKILCRDFFQQYIIGKGHVLEIGAGYCEFINNIQSERKTALDINPDIKNYAVSNVNIILNNTSLMSEVSDNSVDMVFASNLFEHLTRDEITATFREIHRVLAPGGRFMVLQPNIRFCAKDYWMFFDHITPIDDRAFVEGLEINSFEILEVIERFLPYTTKSRLPKSLIMIQLYLRLRVAWRFFGQQSFILSQKPK
jgi:ubiquinone/menaquinone biosynthesis C-methylase UbiE